VLIAAIAEVAILPFGVRRPVEAPGLGRPAAGQGASGGRTDPEAAGRRRILVVEDDAESREALRALLELSGHQVEAVDGDGVSLERAIGARPQVAVIDIGLPRMNGLDVARLVRSRVGPEILLIALSGYVDRQEEARVRAAGFDACLAKPMDLEQLARLLERPLPPPRA
jgi:CheY-like chemotaxis protein